VKQFWWSGMSGTVCLAVIVAVIVANILLALTLR
jgi:hypothetical protein